MVKSYAHKKVQDDKEDGTSQTKGVKGTNAAIKKYIKCFSYKKIGHMKHDFPK